MSKWKTCWVKNIPLEKQHLFSSIDNPHYMDYSPPFLQENLVPLPSMIFQKSQPPINEGGSHYENICNICSKSIIMTLKQFLCSCESYSGVSVVDLQQEFICPLVQSYCSSMFINKLAFIVYQKMLWLAENNLA